MENNLEEPLRPAEIAGYLGMARRTLERRFDRELGLSPARKYLEIRLARSRLAVTRSNQDLREIADSTGFASLSHFISSFHRMFGSTPAVERARRKING